MALMDECGDNSVREVAGTDYAFPDLSRTADRLAAQWEALKGDVGGAAVMAKLISPEGAAMADSVLGTMADLEAKR